VGKEKEEAKREKENREAKMRRKEISRHLSCHVKRWTKGKEMLK